MRALLLALFLGHSPFVVPPPPGLAAGGVVSTGACATMASGDVCCFDNNGVQCGFPLTDATPDLTRAFAISASPIGAGGNLVGGNMILAGGQGSMTLVCTQANCGASDTVSVTVDGTTKTCTRDAALDDSTHFTCGASNAAMCTNAAACLATATGVKACAGAGCTLFTGVSGTAYVYRASDEPGGANISVASSGDHAVAGNGTDGSVEAATALLCDVGATINKTISADSATTNTLETVNLTSPVDTTGTNTHQGILVTPTIGNATGGTNTVNMIATGTVAGDAQVSLNGLKIGQLTTATAGTEIAVNIGDGWDSGVLIGITTAVAPAVSIQGGTLFQARAGGSQTTAFWSRAAGIATMGANTTSGGTCEICASNGGSTTNIGGGGSDAITLASLTTLQNGYTYPNSTKLLQTSVATVTLAAAATSIGAGANIFKLACDGGGNTIDTMSGVGTAGEFTIIFTDALCHINDADDGGSNTFDLDETDSTGDNDIDSADDMVLHVVRDGTLWRQTGRISIN